MEKKVLVRLLIILLAISWVVYAVAVPATRSSMMGKMDPSVQDQLAAKDDLVLGIGNSQEQFDKEGSGLEGKMMLEIEDYPKTGPNPAHNPKSPGKS